jgi:hypothetical protein
LHPTTTVRLLDAEPVSSHWHTRVIAESLEEHQKQYDVDNFFVHMHNTATFMPVVTENTCSVVQDALCTFLAAKLNSLHRFMQAHHRRRFRINGMGLGCFSVCPLMFHLKN